MPEIFVDADACPVKQEVYRVAERYGLRVTLVSNQWIRAPAEVWIRLEVVGNALDAADDWIAERVAAGDIVVSEDIILASRCLESGARGSSPDLCVKAEEAPRLRLGCLGDLLFLEE